MNNCARSHILVILWGRLVTCGRLAIGLTIFLHSTRRITNPPQVTNLPHMIRINLRRSRAVPLWHRHSCLCWS